jgi:hypothetical protein
LPVSKISEEEKQRILEMIHERCETCGEFFPILQMFYNEKKPKPHQFWCERCVKFQKEESTH